jgi:hypothetical protein
MCVYVRDGVHVSMPVSEGVGVYVSECVCQ